MKNWLMRLVVRARERRECSIGPSSPVVYDEPTFEPDIRPWFSGKYNEGTKDNYAVGKKEAGQ